MRSIESSRLPESVRILIPNIALSMIYEPRSKLGSVHVKPINLDFLDARLTVTAAGWIIGEFLRLYHTREPEKVDKLIRDVGREYIPILEQSLLRNLDKINVQDLIVLYLLG